MLLPNNRKTLLIDGIGAVISTLSLGVIAVYFQSYFGMPTFELRLLSGIAFIFAIYSLSAYLWSGDFWRLFLRLIAICNLLYCLASAFLLIEHAKVVTMLGWLYFIPEILLVGTLAVLELKISSSNDVPLSKS